MIWMNKDLYFFFCVCVNQFIGTFDFLLQERIIWMKEILSKTVQTTGIIIYWNVLYCKYIIMEISCSDVLFIIFVQSQMF